ncbi:MAG: biopolymer transporter ExbD [Acidobacteria bacterium]|nr:biopolymer transporter ExbD [Acidobacteriota bacterium]
MEFRKKKPREIKIDIHPLIDVVFLLLIFFMVTTTFVERPGLKLELPKAKSATQERMKELIITVSRNKRVFFQGREVAVSNLESLLKKALAQSETKQVIIRADRKVEYGFIVEIMDFARRSGARGLTIATEEIK